MADVEQRSLADELRESEEELLLSSVRKNECRLTEILADEFREFATSGRIFTREEVILALRDEPPDVDMSLCDFEVFRLSAGVALITYRGVKQAGGSLPILSLRSSLWIFRDGRWQIVFHQGTNLPSKNDFTPLPD